MSNIKQIIIELKNLTDEEQIKLWISLWHFADNELSPKKELFIFVKTKEDTHMEIDPQQPDIEDIAGVTKAQLISEYDK